MSKPVWVWHLTKPCVVCEQISRVFVEQDKLNRWRGGELVQKVWPEKTADERELLMTGTHPECWDKMMGGGR